MTSELAGDSAGNVEASQPPTLSSRIARYDEFFDPKKRATAYRKTNLAGVSKHFKKLNKKNPILVVRRVLSKKGDLSTTEVDVKGPKLAEFLRTIYQDADGLDIAKNPPSCNSKLLAHTRYAFQDELVGQGCSKTPDVELMYELEVALTFVQEDFGAAFADAEAMIHSDSPSITFELLWTLFRPGSLLYNRNEQTEQDRILRTIEYDIGYSAEKGWYASIQTEMITYDGKVFGPGKVFLEVGQYKGSRKLRDLPAYPLELYSEAEALKAFAIQRGRKYVTLLEHSFHEIVEGPALYEESSGFNSELRKFRAHGRVMVDPVMFRAEQRAFYSQLNPRVSSRIDLSEMGDEHYMLCNPVVLGFSFTAKRWGGFALDRLRDIAWTNRPFELLVLNKGTKDLVHSMVKQHAQGTSEFDDIVKGKGQGLIGLLCGPPGCGKTLTAEAVAEATQRPLYCLSAGELGTETTVVEENLTQVLQLAQRWRAVILLDEADVFLAQRDSTDIQRNALVSIFLRKLEYYQGIMILTTNLITRCDIAFESRIHFTIHYPQLSRESQKQIWSTFISQSTGSKLITEGDIETLCTENTLNGRQIKNSVAVAQSFATGNGQELSLKHIVTVLGVVRDWQKAKADSLDAEQLEEAKTSKPQQTAGSFDPKIIALIALAFISGLFAASTLVLGLLVISRESRGQTVLPNVLSEL